jgi:glyoxylase-like metal-dependent hydrolase (beta-lactamase superfamily II)
MSSTGEDMLDALGQLGFEPRDIKGILLTHWHNDHAAGAGALKALSGAVTLYHKSEEPFLMRQTASKGLRGYLAKKIPELGPLVLFKGLLGEASPEAVEATSFVSDKETVFDEFEVIATPGHTAGHISFYHHDKQALFAGDALAVIDGKLRYMAKLVTPDRQMARDSILSCLNRPIKIVCPGHREPLISNAHQECERLREHAGSNKPWPFWG